MAFGAALRDAVTRDSARFDRIAILKETEAPVMQATQGVIRTLDQSMAEGGEYPTAARVEPWP